MPAGDSRRGTVCRRCGKPRGETVKSERYYCSDCRPLIRQKYYDPEKDRRRKLLSLYGITLEEYARLLRRQKGRCAVCRTAKPGGLYNIFQVDHDHKTNKVRGLLCAACNRALGLFKEKEKIVRRAADYLLNAGVC